MKDPFPQKPGDRLIFGEVFGPVATQMIAVYHQDRPTLVITDDMQSAYQCLDELNYWLTDVRVRLFPDYETLPYDPFSPHQEIISDRMSALYHLLHDTSGITIAPVQALMHRIMPTHFIDSQVFMLKRGDTFDLKRMKHQFDSAGYRFVKEVLSHGEYSVRGSIVDIFPMGSDTPFRLDLFDDEIDSLRHFDPETQRSLATVETVTCLPAHAFSLDQASRDRFYEQWARFFPNNLNSSTLANIQQGQSASGIEYYLPLFFETSHNLLNYLPDNARIVSLAHMHQKLTEHTELIKQRYAQRQFDEHSPALPPKAIFFGLEELLAHIKNWPVAEISASTLGAAGNKHNTDGKACPNLQIMAHEQDPYVNCRDFLKTLKTQAFFVADSDGRASILREHLQRMGIQAPIYSHWRQDIQDPIAILSAPFLDGGYDPVHQRWWITENVLFAKHPHRNRRKKQTAEQSDHVFIRDITEITPGDPITHLEHGVGTYQGLTTLTLGGQENEFLTLEYRNEDKLYVPVSQLHLISRYSNGDLGQSPMDKLGGERWKKAKEKAAKRLKDVAADLLAVYAQREAKPGFRFPAPDEEYTRFAEQFPFDLTDDQEKAIQEVMHDLNAPRPMDRLLCGDVGFGKTEVALRAAFLVAAAGKQVALLAPTTLLCEQHAETFARRFADFPITVGALSRFQSAKEQKTMIQELADGKVDVVIGTHKLLSKQVQFKDLGLVIIDEEHRFGVAHKERLKRMRSEVDILAMTATPIPRTLNLAFAHLRDLSVISTAPAKRLAVRTFVKAYDDDLIKEAISREVLRGGQVYYLHNSVATIEKKRDDLQAMMPHLKIAIGHGQMHERQLEQVMSQFYQNQFHLLLCTTIIETGIDVPNVNTIIIEHADHFGLAQLHQLRGRVGRSYRQAYAYLLTPQDMGCMTPDAHKRLDAIQKADTLGAGFTLASFDLDIRGAGELLGEEQSGHVQAIGFNLYMDLLERTVTALKKKDSFDLDALIKDPHVDVSLGLSAMIPEDYVNDIATRLQFYHEISQAQTTDDLDNVQATLIDRFGLMPEPVENLLAQAQLRIDAGHMGIRKLEASEQVIQYHFSPSPRIRQDEVIQLIQKKPKMYQLKGHTLVQHADVKTAQTRIDTIRQCLARIAV